MLNGRDDKDDKSAEFAESFIEELSEAIAKYESTNAQKSSGPSLSAHDKIVAEIAFLKEAGFSKDNIKVFVSNLNTIVKRLENEGRSTNLLPILKTTLTNFTNNPQIFGFTLKEKIEKSSARIDGLEWIGIPGAFLYQSHAWAPLSNVTSKLLSIYNAAEINCKNRCSLEFNENIEDVILPEREIRADVRKVLLSMLERNVMGFNCKQGRESLKQLSEYYAANSEDNAILSVAGILSELLEDPRQLRELVSREQKSSLGTFSGSGFFSEPVSPFEDEEDDENIVEKVINDIRDRLLTLADNSNEYKVSFLLGLLEMDKNATFDDLSTMLNIFIRESSLSTKKDKIDVFAAETLQKIDTEYNSKNRLFSQLYSPSSSTTAAEEKKDVKRKNK